VIALNDTGGDDGSDRTGPFIVSSRSFSMERGWRENELPVEKALAVLTTRKGGQENVREFRTPHQRFSFQGRAQAGLRDRARSPTSSTIFPKKRAWTRARKSRPFSGGVGIVTAEELVSDAKGHFPDRPGRPGLACAVPDTNPLLSEESYEAMETAVYGKTKTVI